MRRNKRKYYTSRGFGRIDFMDSMDHSKCSIQRSSSAEQTAVWLGCNEGMHYDDDDGRQKCSARMHVDRNLAKWLIKKLQKFVNTGDL